MPTPPDPTPKPSTGIHVGDLTGERDVNVTLTDVAGGDQIKITNSPGATVIKEAPRKLTREEQLAQRNRQTMLLKVKAYWIDGVLANSLHSKVIPLDMERKPDAVTQPRPWDMLWQHRDQQPQPLPPGTRIIDRFNYAAGDALLILGEPGSGKTTMMLELAGELLEWAEQNEALRIPVVFNLSSWAVTRPPLTEWLVSELQTLYLIPKKVAQTWVEQDDILPLLDGLDEVAQEHRAACIKAINTYREAQGTPLVVCSRIADYEAIGEKLLLSDGLLLRPLTSDQINDYLLAGGPALDGVRLGLPEDEVLQEMAQSPLMLSIMAVAYRDQAPEQFTSTNVDERGRELFATYIQRQLSQRRKDLAEDPATTLRQLTYLAHQMITHNQTIFPIEYLQPDWLSIPQHLRRYRWTFVFAFALYGGIFGWIFGWTFQLGAWMIGDNRFVGNLLGSNAPIWGLVLGLPFGFYGGLVFGQLSIEAIRNTSWSRERMKSQTSNRFLRSLFFMSILGMIGGLLSVRIVELFTGPSVYMRVGILTATLGWILISGVLARLTFGIRFRETPIHIIPKGILRRSSQTIIGILIVLAVLFRMLGEMNEMAMLFLLIVFLPFVLVLVPNGVTAMQHYVLRFWLHYYGYLPGKLTPFLDLAAERLILQKVGGGYRFVHRLLQEYLASLYEGEGAQS